MKTAQFDANNYVPNGGIEKMPTDQIFRIMNAAQTVGSVAAVARSVSGIPNAAYIISETCKAELKRRGVKHA